jgi:hypothetical protein
MLSRVYVFLFLCANCKCTALYMSHRLTFIGHMSACLKPYCRLTVLRMCKTGDFSRSTYKINLMSSEMPDSIERVEPLQY